MFPYKHRSLLPVLAPYYLYSTATTHASITVIYLLQSAAGYKPWSMRMSCIMGKGQ